MRVQRRALVLEADGYETPIFSPDGRYLVIRGNAYGNTLDVFEFPSLKRVLATTLDGSRHNMAFGSHPTGLWVGTPHGTLLELDLDDRQMAEHNMLGGAAVTALSATAAGQLLVASGEGQLHLLSVLAGSATTQAKPTSVAAFLDATSDVPDGIDDLWSHLTLTDGERTWDSDDRATVTAATTADPGWLQIQAAMNRHRGQANQYSAGAGNEPDSGPWL